VPVGGAGLSNEIAGLFLLILGVEVRAPRIPYERFTVEYRQGAPVSIDREDDAEWKVQFGGYLGFEVPLT
jgi:hypothetical protein